MIPIPSGVKGQHPVRTAPRSLGWREAAKKAGFSFVDIDELCEVIDAQAREGRLHLDDMAARVTAGAHAILILDQAGWLPATYRSCRCRRVRRSSTPQETSGSSCDRTGCRIESSNPSTTSSTIAAMLGTSSSISPGKSCLSHPRLGRRRSVNLRVGITIG